MQPPSKGLGFDMTIGTEFISNNSEQYLGRIIGAEMVEE